MINYSLFIQSARRLAEQLHKGQCDKAGKDYFEGHLQTVASKGETWVEVIAGYLHDASEDTPHSTAEVLQRLEEIAGEKLPSEARETLKMVLKLLNSHRYGTREAYIKAIGEHPVATAVKLHDLEHNLDISRIPNPTEKDLTKHQQYEEEYRYLSAQYKKMRKPRIPFIHGYSGGAFGATATELQRQLGEGATLFAPAFSNELSSFENMLANIHQAQMLVDNEGIDLVIGSSMGGFTALRIKECPKIVINPCMKPSERLHLPEFGNATQTEIDKYNRLEETLAPTPFEVDNTWALFAENDELFSYRWLFDQLFDSSHALSVPGGHRNNPARIRENIIPLLEKTLILR